jgi:hypothetical protein
MVDEQFDIPILLLVFNRLDTLEIVFKAIKKRRPLKIYLACDGARPLKFGEREQVDKVRKYVLENINWRCEIKTLFRENNLGCGKAVSSAISWLFENEEIGIILEDDCLPSETFFDFCRENLLYYKDSEEIYHINGSNFQEGNNYGSDSYFFSKYPFIWGWASWRRAWRNYSYTLESFNQKNDNSLMFNKYWSKIFVNMKEGKIDTWDYQWVYTIWKNKGKAITPNVSLVKNIGFDSNATHTQFEPTWNKKNIYGNIITILHPENQDINFIADKFIDKTIFTEPPLFKRAIKYIDDFIKKSI